MPELRPFAAHRMNHRERVLLAAAIGHAVDFFVWRSLRRQKLTDEEIVELMIGMIRRI